MFWWIFSGLFPWKKNRRKNPPKNPRQHSNRNLGVSPPKSILQGSGLERSVLRVQDRILKQECSLLWEDVWAMGWGTHVSTLVSKLIRSGPSPKFLNTVIFEIITFLIQKHFKTVTVTVILRKLIQMTFKTVIGSQWKSRSDSGGQDGNGNGNSSEFQDGNSRARKP